MEIDKKILFECRLLKQVGYKVRNQLGRSIQYRRLQEVYKNLLRFVKGLPVPEFSEVLVKAGLSVLDPLVNKILVPVYSVLLGIYARVFSSVQSFRTLRTKIVSRKLKRIISLQKSLILNKKRDLVAGVNKKITGIQKTVRFKTNKTIEPFNPLPEISEFLESIRNSINRNSKFS
jgi:hypothetical protein